MTVTREDLNPCTVLLNITCEPEEVKDGFEKAFKQISKNIRLPGFRPGHAPRAMVEPMIDPRTLGEEAADAIVRKIATKAIDQEEIKPDPSQRPMVDLKKLDKDASECEFSIKLGLPPIVELGEYKGLPGEKPPAEVTDEEIEYQLEEIRKRRSTRQAVTDRGVVEGDIAVLNVKVDGEEGDGRTFMTVVGKTFPQLDEALMGMKVEEMKHAELAFPENFQEKDWAGKTLPAIVTVSSLSAVQMPEIDEAFAKSLKTENVDELKSRLRDMIVRAKEDGIRDMVNEQLLDTLLERSTVHVPDNMWENLAAQRLRDMAEEAAREGKSLKDQAEENGMTVEQLADYWKEKARIQVKRALLIREVFTKEQMQLNDQDLNQELYAMAREYDMSAEELVGILKKNNQLEELHFRAIARKVGEFLIQNADMKEVAMA